MISARTESFRSANQPLEAAGDAGRGHPVPNDSGRGVPRYGLADEDAADDEAHGGRNEREGGNANVLGQPTVSVGFGAVDGRNRVRVGQDGSSIRGGRRSAVDPCRGDGVSDDGSLDVVDIFHLGGRGGLFAALATVDLW